MRSVLRKILTLLPIALLPNLPVAAAVNAVGIDGATMVRAFPAQGLGGADASDAHVVQARELVTKSLGDDARDLVFIPVTPCTVWDTRFATDPNSSGVIADSATKKFYTHFDGAGGSYGPWGGNPSCPETAQNTIGMRPFAVMMTAYINDPTGNGWVTFYRDGDVDPSQATISVYYSPGPTRTQTVISKSSRGYGSGTYDVAVTSRFASTHVSASVVGYFLKPVNIVLPNSTATTGNIMKGAGRFIHNFGTNNFFAGVNAGNFFVTGAHNTGVGVEALRDISTGNYNTAVGYNSLRVTTNGFGNTAIGPFALYQVSSGALNVALGVDALIALTTGSHNIALGTDAGQNITTGSDNILIGHVGGSAAEASTIRVGTPGFQTRAFIAGIRGVTTANADAVPVLIDNAGQLGTVNSSRRVKDDLADMSDASSALMKLRPVTFHYKADQSRHLHYGLVAEEVAQVYPDLVAKSADGQIETVMYQYLPPMLLNEYQKQQREIAALKQERAAQAAEIAALKQGMAGMAQAVARLQRSVPGAELR